MSDYGNPNKGFIKFNRKKDSKIPSIILILSITLLIFGVVLYIHITFTNDKQEKENQVFVPPTIARNSENSSEGKKQATQVESISQYENNSQSECEVRVDDLPYWVVFHEGFRAGRLEMSTFEAEEDFQVTWNNNLICKGQIGKCNQYYYDKGDWTQIGTYGILTDKALDVVASNVDIYDANGVRIYEKSPILFQDIDFSHYSNN